MLDFYSGPYRHPRLGGQVSNRHKTHFSGACGSPSMTYFVRAIPITGTPGIILPGVDVRGKAVAVVGGDNVDSMFDSPLDQTIARVGAFGSHLSLSNRGSFAILNASQHCENTTSVYRYSLGKSEVHHCRYYLQFMLNTVAQEIRVHKNGE